MEKVYAALLGAAIGGVWVAGELLLLLFMLKRGDQKAAAALAAGTADRAAVQRTWLNSALRFFVSKYLLNVLLLVALFLGRRWLPWPWQYTLVTTALMLTLAFQLALMCSGINKKLKGNLPSLK